ncbi:helix-turn-helix domain-containing protein [Alloprevotella sp. Lung230]|uniref:helix-turn-helix domain-containing protein n=1 Tax=Alloprevotella sp. Lung230 TaxID=2766595 RepID=UPI00210395AE|nr:helix-turn-helix domain-containing protein [Alloprevotella sp. Lung230]
MNTENKQSLRFDDIPEVLGWIKRKLVELDAKIDVIQGKKQLAVEEDKWFSIQALSNYLPEHPAVQTIYSWTSAKRIPYHREDKRLRFLKSEIDAWLKKPEAHLKSIEQIEDEARQ